MFIQESQLTITIKDILSQYIIIAIYDTYFKYEADKLYIKDMVA